MNGDSPSSSDDDGADGGSETENSQSEAPPNAGADPTATPSITSPPPDDATTGHTRSWIVGAVGAVVVVVGVVIAIVVLTSPSAGISAGSGTATISWIPVTGGNPDTIGNPPQPFTGSIEGTSLNGIATTPFTSDGKKVTGLSPLSGKILFIQWKGSFGGKLFNVGVYADYHHGTPLTNPPGTFPSLTIAGKWGNQAVEGRIATPSAAELKRGNPPAHFAGTVGDLKVSGTAQPPAGGGSHPSGTATFTVSR